MISALLRLTLVACLILLAPNAYALTAQQSVASPGGACTTGYYAWPDSNGLPLACISSVWVEEGGGSIQGPILTTATTGASCSAVGQMAKEADGDGTLLVCDNAPSTIKGADCSAEGPGVLTMDTSGELYSCLK